MVKFIQTAKWFAIAMATVLVSPLIVVVRIENWLDCGERWYSACAEGLSLIPGRSGALLRLAYYRLTLQACGWNVVFAFGTKINHREAEIGRDVVFGCHCNIGTVTIADQVLVGSRVCIPSGSAQHDTTSQNENLLSEPPVFHRVHVGAKTWIGEGAIVLADVGSRCVVAAGSVVVRPLPEGVMAMGNPARVISREFARPDATSGGTRSSSSELTDHSPP